MEQNREPRNKPTHLWSINLQQTRQEHTIKKKTIVSTSGAGKVGQSHANQWIYNTSSHHTKKQTQSGLKSEIWDTTA